MLLRLRISFFLKSVLELSQFDQTTNDLISLRYQNESRKVLDEEHHLLEQVLMKKAQFKLIIFLLSKKSQ